MDGAAADASAAKRTRQAHVFQYRDGLIIALLALIPLRRRTLAALRIGRHLIKAGDLWELDIPAADTKTRRPLDYTISKELSARIDLYLERFRGRIPGADKHTSLWPSNLSRPMCPDAIYYAVLKRTKRAFGFGVNLHRFRHAAASFWSSHDPVNVRGVKDLLGQTSFATTEGHYIMAQSRLAGRALARAIGKRTSGFLMPFLNLESSRLRIWGSEVRILPGAPTMLLIAFSVWVGGLTCINVWRCTQQRGQQRGQAGRHRGLSTCAYLQ